MSFGIFEASITSEDETQRVLKEATNKLEAAIYDVTQEFAPFLTAARDKNEFNDRVALSMDAMMKTVNRTIPPKTGTMNRVVASQKKLWHQRQAALDNKSDEPTEKPEGEESKPHTSPESTRKAIGEGDYGKVEKSLEDKMNKPKSPEETKHSSRLRTAMDYAWQQDPDDPGARIAWPDDDSELTVDPNGEDLWDWDCKSNGSSKGSGTTDDPTKAQQAAEDCYNIDVKKIYAPQEKESVRSAGLEDAEDYIPKDDWQGYLEERSTPATRRVKQRNFGDRGENDWENTGDHHAGCSTPMPPRRSEEEEEERQGRQPRRTSGYPPREEYWGEQDKQLPRHCPNCDTPLQGGSCPNCSPTKTSASSLAVQMYSDFCDSNGLPKVSERSFVAYAGNLSEPEQWEVWGAIVEAGRDDYILSHTKDGAVYISKQDGGDKDCPTCHAAGGEPCMGEGDWEMPFFHKTRKGSVTKEALGLGETPGLQAPKVGPSRPKRRTPKAPTPTPGVGTEPYNPFQPGVGSQADTPSDPGYNPFGQPAVPQVPQVPNPLTKATHVKVAEQDERSLLDKADKALTDLLNQRAQTFQDTLGPLQQALQAIQYAEQVESTMAPMNVVPPAGTLNPMPDQGGAAPGAIGAPQVMPMGPQGGVPGMGNDPLMQGAQLAQPPDRKSSSRNSLEGNYNQRMTANWGEFPPQANDVFYHQDKGEGRVLGTHPGGVYVKWKDLPDLDTPETEVIPHHEFTRSTIRG